MDEQLTIDGMSEPMVAIVPAVAFHARTFRRKLRGAAEIRCGHCQMNASRWHDDPASLPQWPTEHSIVVLDAVYRITQTDGSTLDLCAQHADNHAQRGDHDD